MKLSIYFAGSIQKDHEQNDSYWTEEDFASLRTLLDPHYVHILNPAERTDDLSDEFAVFGRDMTQIYLADLLFVDARHRRGLGVGAEMMWAKVLGKPVVALAPKESHYRKAIASLLGQPIDDYIHPFVESLSDCIADSLEEGAAWILEFASGEVGPIKDLETIEEAMQYYREMQFPQDKPMKQLIESSEMLQERFNLSPKFILK
ncbi:MAG: hypothetical protein KDK56_06430 [Simkania sp.]|nr:hypothetical protein [Simkania sp.]MCB1073914.1 hypothetical protein [Simkania sp.]MCP5490904.1 hypothetical protein [Chlamydiales bacterium]